MTSFVPLSSVARVNPRLPKGVDPNQKVSFVPMAAVSEQGQLVEQETRILADTKKGYTYFERGDILVAKITPCFENGKAALVSNLNHQIGFGSTEFHVLRPDSERLDPKFLFYLLWNEQFRCKGKDSMQGAAGQKRVSADFLKGYEIPLPPLSEQKRIANLFDKVESLRRKRRQSIELADQFLRSVFLELFGDPVINSKRLETRLVSRLCKLVRGSSPRPKGDPKYYGGPVPRLMVQDLTRDGLYVTPSLDSLTEEGAKKSRPVEAGTVVMAVSGNVGLTAILEINACVHDGFVAFTELNEHVVLPEYFLYVMTLLKVTHKNREAGAIFKNLTTTQIKEMEIPIPSIHRQREFSQIVSRFSGVLENLTRSLDESEMLMSSISKEAFSD